MRTFISLSTLILLFILATPGCTHTTQPDEMKEAAGESTVEETDSSAREASPEDAAPAQLWQFATSPVCVGGTAYTGSADGHLQALDPTTGDELWRYRTGGWSWCTPLVNEDTIYIGAISAHPYYFEGVTLERGVHAVDRRTGVKKWSMATGELSGGYITGGVHASPVMADGVLYVAALDGNLYALN